MRRRLWIAIVCAAAPRPAWALCASCLGQSSSLGSALRLVGLFLLVPPAIFFAVAIAIRRLTRRGQGGAAASAAGSGGGVQRG